MNAERIVLRDGRQLLAKDGWLIPLAETPAPVCSGGTNRVLPWRYTDPAITDDPNACAVIAIAIATGTTVKLDTPTLGAIDHALTGLGWRYVSLRHSWEPCVAHLGDLPRGRLIVAIDSVPLHMTVLDDHTILDSFNNSDRRFGRAQCVLAYWQRSE